MSSAYTIRLSEAYTIRGRLLLGVRSDRMPYIVVDAGHGGWIKMFIW